MNIVTVAGNLGRAAELRQTKTGRDVLSFSVADNQIGKDASGQPLPPLWWNCQMWGERAVKLAPHLPKGAKVTVVGRASLRQYEGRDGAPRTSLEVNVSEIALQSQSLSSQGEQDAGAPPQQAYGQSQPTYADVKGHGMKQPAPQRAKDEAWQAVAAPAPMGAFDDAPMPDEDLPF